MKFLCIPCDTPMTVQTVGPPDRGSLSVVYSCPECGYEIAMLTNAYETQIVQSLGVRIGPQALRPASGPVGGDAPSPASTSAGRDLTSGGGCPFAAMIPSTEGAITGVEHATTTSIEPAGGASMGSETGPVQADERTPIRWTAAAEARLERVPSFVRPMARAGIERFAREHGSQEVDEKILDAAREFFGM